MVLAARRGSVSSRGVPVVGRDLLGDQVLVDLVELAVNGFLALQVLTVQPFDEFMSWLLALEVRVVAVAEVELAARGRVVADPPAAWLVAVVLLDQLVERGADRAEDAELFQVRAEPGPEPVVRAGSLTTPVCTWSQWPKSPPWTIHTAVTTTAAHIRVTMATGRHFTPVTSRCSPVTAPGRHTPVPAQATFFMAESTLCALRRSSIPIVICETP
jgi:hypothetical protein